MIHAKSLAALLLVAVSTLLASCGGGVKPSGTTSSTASAITLFATGSSVASDGSTSVTLTATTLTSGNAALAGQVLSFSTSTGVLSTSSVTTDASGKATVTFAAGSSKTNSTAMITATASGSAINASIPIQITGSTLTLTPSVTTAATGTPVTISIVTKDSGSNLASNQTLRFSVAPSSTGSGTLSATTATTSTSGSASVNLTGTAAGTVDVLTEWLDAAGSVTASATKSITITAVSGTFSITTPATSPFAVSIGTNQLVVVNVPVGVTSIRYATTLGSWLVNGAKVLTITPPAATDTQTFVPGTSAGNASVQVDALDATGAIMASASRILSISAPSTAAATISLQSNVSVLQPSIGGNLSTATLTAIVKDSNLNPVGGANVLFELVGSTGTGEMISPTVVTTNNITSPIGQAQATFTAGSSSTTQGAAVKATIIGTAISATTPMTVGGTAASVALGASTTIAINDPATNTAYKLPVSVLVSDSNGNRISGAIVSLSLWPVAYYKGVRDAACKAIRVAVFSNEDANENLTLDPGEDIDGPGGFTLGVAPAPSTATFGPVDGALWPAPSAAGSIPATVTTGIDGTATFDWVYLKQYANWVDARIRATIQVQGTQSTTNIVLPLAPLAADLTSTCPLPSSAFN